MAASAVEILLTSVLEALTNADPPIPGITFEVRKFPIFRENDPSPLAVLSPLPDSSETFSGEADEQYITKYPFLVTVFDKSPGRVKDYQAIGELRERIKKIILKWWNISFSFHAGDSGITLDSIEYTPRPPFNLPQLFGGNEISVQYFVATLIEPETIQE